jgi:outer membrane protein assembly factor BamB
MRRFIIALLSIALHASGEANRWPQYRGPAGAGISESAATVEFGPKQNLLWSAALPSGHSSPSIWDDHLFVTGFDTAEKKLELLAFDRRNGKPRWRQEIPAQKIETVHAVSSPATATPIADGERVYVYFGSAGLFCYSFDGKLVWSKPMPTANVGFGSGTSPVLVDEALILARDDGDRHMTAFDRKTGKVLWEIKLDGSGQYAGHATPVVANGQVILHRPGAIAAYSVRDGSKAWSLNVQSQGTGTPVIHGDTLVVGAWGGSPELADPFPDWDALAKTYDKDGDGQVSKEEFPDELAVVRRVDGEKVPGAIVTYKRYFEFMDSDKNSQISKTEWETVQKFLTQRPAGPGGVVAIRMGGGKDVTEQSVAWTEDRAVPEVPVPLVYRDRVYTVTNGGIVTALDESTGKVIYRGRLGAPGMYYSSPVAAGDNLYFASGDGVITVVRAGDKLDVAARNDLGEPIFATPAVLDGRLYVRTAGHLYAFGR